MFKKTIVINTFGIENSIVPGGFDHAEHFRMYCARRAEFTAEQKAPVLEAVAKDLDCLPEKIKVKPKLNLVKRSVFAQAAGDAPNKAFTEQLKSAQKRFKAPAKRMPKTDTRKAC